MAVFPTLTTKPDFPLQPDGQIDDVVIRTSVTGGYELTRPRTTRARRTWGVSYAIMSDADVATLRTFEVTTIKNAADSFTWAHPLTGTNYTVRLAGPVSYSLNKPNMTAVSFTLREV